MLGESWGIGDESMDDALLRQGQRENKKVVPGADGGDICRGKFRSSAEPSCHSSRLWRIEMAGPRSQLILKYTSSLLLLLIITNNNNNNNYYYISLLLLLYIYY
jgi:hypothetical protein